MYVSTATHLMSEAQLEALLLDARTHNQRHGVTGVLLYSGGNFMQCIEGSDVAIQMTYARIAASSQHKHLIELINEPCAERLFPNWHMGLARVTQSQLLALSTADWQREDAQAPDSLGTAPSRHLLHSFWESARG